MDCQHNDAKDLSGQAIDLRINVLKNNVQSGGSGSTSTDCPPPVRCGSATSRDGSKSAKRRNVNIFKKHKLKYRYLLNKSKSASDSGQFGSSSMAGSSTTSNSGSQKISAESTSSPCTSTSPSSGDSHSPENFSNMSSVPASSDPAICMMLGNAVPLVVMMQGQLQGRNQNSSVSYMNTTTTLFKCNMCSMFSNNMTDVLNHVNANHSNVQYCFVCNRFHSDKQEFDKHKSVCATAHQAFQQIIDGHYQTNRQANDSQGNPQQEQALNLTVAGNVAMRAAQIVHNKRGRKNKIKKLQKCTYCKKAFFGRFYLQRHLRSHTGEKLCHCSICGKGFAEWRNLRNHMSRFHNTSESNSSGGGQSKSVSPNLTSDSDQTNNRRRPSVKDKPHTSAMTADIQPNPSMIPTTRHNGGVPPTSAASQETHPVSPYKMERDPSLPSSQLYPIDVDAWSSNSMMYASSGFQPVYTSSTSMSGLIAPPTYSSSASLAPNASNIIDGKQYPMSSKDQNENSASRHPSASTSDDAKPVAYLGSTSSRLELTVGHQGHEQSLNPVSNESGEKVFRCQMCSKVFRTKFAMQRHLDFHADKRPYECTQCDYKAKTKPQLKVHVMRHSGEKGFTCSICNYSCVTHSDLNRHCKSRSHLFRVNLTEKKEAAGENHMLNKTESNKQTN